MVVLAVGPRHNAAVPLYAQRLLTHRALVSPSQWPGVPFPAHCIPFRRHDRPHGCRFSRMLHVLPAPLAPIARRSARTRGADALNEVLVKQVAEVCVDETRKAPPSNRLERFELRRTKGGCMHRIRSASRQLRSGGLRQVAPADRSHSRCRSQSARLGMLEREGAFPRHRTT